MVQTTQLKNSLEFVLNKLGIGTKRSSKKLEESLIDMRQVDLVAKIYKTATFSIQRIEISKSPHNLPSQLEVYSTIHPSQYSPEQIVGILSSSGLLSNIYSFPLVENQNMLLKEGEDWYEEQQRAIHDLKPHHLIYQRAKQLWTTLIANPEELKEKKAEPLIHNSKVLKEKNHELLYVQLIITPGDFIPDKPSSQ